MFFRFSAVSVAAVVGVLATAPLAHADENTYLQQVRATIPSNFVASDGQLIQLGYVACRALNNGGGLSAADEAVAEAGWNMGLRPGLAGAMDVSQAAQRYLC